MTVVYGSLLVSQLEFYWEAHLRPRLDGLINREVMHHGGEIGVLRDLYRLRAAA
jgi:hypothetical protein